MPHLAGVFDPAVTPNVLERQLSRIRCASVPCTEWRLVDDGIAAALVDTGVFANGAQPARNAVARSSLMLDGEIFNLHELAAQHGVAFERVAGAAEICLALLEKRGHALLGELAGFFNILWYEAGARRLRIISDRFGFRPLFYCRRSQRFAFGTELKAVKAAIDGVVALDRVGIMQLLCLGSHIGTRTWLEEHRRIAPATVLTVDASGVHEEQYWKFRYDEAAPALDQPTYVTNFAKLLDRSVERQVSGSGRAAVFLSGGYDSRALAAAIRPHHLPMPAFTFGRPDSRDARIAPLLAARLGLEHHLLSNTDDYLHAHCRAIAWRIEGTLPLHRTTSIQHHELLARHAQVFLLGFLAELSGSHTWPALMLAPSRTAAINTLFDRMTGARRALARRVLRPEVFDAGFDAMRSEFALMFEGIDNDAPMNIADVWRTRFLYPRSTYQAAAIDRYRFEARAPHIDNDLVDFQLRIPPWARLEQRVYKKVIAYSYPAIRDIPCTNSMRPIDPLFARAYAQMAVDVAGRKFTGLLHRLAGRGHGMGREITDYAADFRRQRRLWSDILEPLLARAVFDPALFDVDGIRRIAAEHFDGAARHEEMLGTLIGWGLAAKYLLLEDFADLPEVFRPR